MPASKLLLGAVLTFANVEGTELSLTVNLTENATVALDWGGTTHSSTISKNHHLFTGLPVPFKQDLNYLLAIGSKERRNFTVVKRTEPLKVALYGDSRHGPGPHGQLIKQIARYRPHLLVHTGDIVHSAVDYPGWKEFLTVCMPVCATTPTIFALGNHELYTPGTHRRKAGIDGRRTALEHLPPPEDSLARAQQLASGIYHVVVGDSLFVSLDSNLDLGITSSQLRFLEQLHQRYPKTKYRFLALHQGPLSSGRHGGHHQGAVLLKKAEELGYTAILSGHDHLYERLVHGSLTAIVSGGGGAPLYQRGHFEPGSQVFASTYNWVALSLGKEGQLSAYTAEGVLLDQAPLKPGKLGVLPPAQPWKAASAAGVFLVAWLGVLVHLGRRPRQKD